MPRPRYFFVMMRFLPLLLLLTPVDYASADEAYRTLYQQGAYTEALQALEQSTVAKEETSVYFFNRGVIHHALNQHGLAVAYLEKANSMGAQDPELEEALRTSRIALGKFIGASKLDATSKPWEVWGDRLPLDLILIGLASLSFLGILAFFITKRVSLGLVGSGIVLTLIVWGWESWMSAHPPGMVVESRIARSGPGDEFLERGTVETGMKLRLSGTSPVKGWYRVRINEAGEEGFLPGASLLLFTDGSNKP